MSEKTKISWCDSTWNYWIGCTKVAEECANCYAAEQDQRRFSRTLGEGTPENPVRHWGKGQPRHLTSEATRFAPLKWNKKAIGQHRVFCGSLMDWADEEVPDEWRREMFRVADQCKNLTFLFLTKRPENAYKWFKIRYTSNGLEIPRHFWVGMSWMQAKSQEVEWLLKIPAMVRFLSIEPILEPFQIGDFDLPSIQWIIFGGESGKNARPCNVAWIRDGLYQCRAASVKCFVKQLGSFCIEEHGSQRSRICHDDPKGGDPTEWPEDLRVQEFPKL